VLTTNERCRARARGVCWTLLFTVSACAPETSSTEAQSASPRAAAADDHTVTLITGDRVVLRHGAPLVTPARGRTNVAFLVERTGDRVRVVPDDVAPLIAAGQLDAALFDVSLLLDSGYGDRERDDIPLIVTHAPAASGLARGAGAGVIVDRALPALNAIAARQPKANAGAALAALGASSALAGGAPTKIWLDRIRKPSLDHSVPQIGGPAARARGFTGAGITVAVLDTGVDSAHPDLAGKVIAAQDFTGDGQGAGDVVGHGTHVASIIAGSGAASGGQLAGVAPGAQLLSGRVCLVFGCPDSAILAGMSWAVAEQHAPIVNLSLGGTDTPEIDPIEDAVNRLSAQFGTLFVIAAGNRGAAGTIESPGSADAALTVGAVDRDDQLALFSSEGPRNGDRAVKPDVAAPGVDIVAARAAGVPPIGVPVGDVYMALSGTSMATPHAAGAAALILQQHVGWTGAQLKAQLIATADPSAEQTAFQQGAGRIDVDRGTRQDVTADPPSLSLGVASFPHDDDPPIVRTVRYRNGGATPVALALAASLSCSAGGATPPGMIQVEPSQLTVPAGGTADATVTVTTSGDSPNGLYSGALVATGGDVRVETAIGVEREIESFELSIDVVGGNGTPTRATVIVTAAGGGGGGFLFINGHIALRLPRGSYSVDVHTTSSPLAFMSYPRLELDADKALVFDARLARPLEVDVGDPTVRLASVGWTYVDFPRSRSFSAFGFGVAISAAHVGPDAAPDELVGFASATQTDTDPSTAPSLIYNLAHAERGHIPTGWRETAAREQIATVIARHAGRDDGLYNKVSFAIYDDPREGLIGVGSSLLLDYNGPFQRTERFFAPGFLWEDVWFDNRLLPEQPDFPTEVAEEFSFHDRRPGTTVTEQWNQAVIGPAFPTVAVFDGAKFALGSSASRTGDQLVLRPSMVSDSASPARNTDTLFDRRRLALFRNGVLVEERKDTFDPFEVPPEAATYRYELELARPADLFELSPQVTAAYTFRSQHSPGDAPRSLPLLTMRFRPELDQHNRTSARVMVLPIAFERPPGAGTPLVVRASLEVSFDGGARWSRVPVIVLGDRALAVIVHRAGATAVSLRGSATDVAGNQIEQTILQAYGLAQ
jgi:subtilisin family serine protease